MTKKNEEPNKKAVYVQEGNLRNELKNESKISRQGRNNR